MKKGTIFYRQWDMRIVEVPLHGTFEQAAEGAAAVGAPGWTLYRVSRPQEDHIDYALHLTGLARLGILHYGNMVWRSNVATVEDVEAALDTWIQAGQPIE